MFKREMQWRINLRDPMTIGASSEFLYLDSVWTGLLITSLDSRIPQSVRDAE